MCIRDRLLTVANVDPVHESGHGDEARADILVQTVIQEMQPGAPDFELVGRAGIVVAVSKIA